MSRGGPPSFLHLGNIVLLSYRDHPVMVRRNKPVCLQQSLFLYTIQEWWEERARTWKPPICCPFTLETSGTNSGSANELETQGKELKRLPWSRQGHSWATRCQAFHKPVFGWEYWHTQLVMAAGASETSTLRKDKQPKVLAQANWNKRIFGCLNSWCCFPDNTW